MNEIHLLRVENSQECVTYLLNSGIITIGRALSNRITVNDQLLDRHHAYLRRFPSANGSHQYEIIIGARQGQICHQGTSFTPAPCEGITLVTGDSITLGSTSMSYLVTSMSLAECKLYFDAVPTDLRSLQSEDVAYICASNAA